MKQALHFSKEMLKELRSQELTPRNYYELYMKVLEELRYLEEYFLGLTRNGTMVKAGVKHNMSNWICILIHDFVYLKLNVVILFSFIFTIYSCFVISLLINENAFVYKYQCSELYEQVQSCGMVLPRLYLLVTVGGVYIKSKQAPAKDILKVNMHLSPNISHSIWRNVDIRHLFTISVLPSLALFIHSFVVVLFCDISFCTLCWFM